MNPSSSARAASSGICYLAGAGPGDLGLVTLRVKELVEQAEVVVFDYLCNPEILKWAPAGAEIIYAGKKAGQHTLKQPEINALIVEKTAAGSGSCDSRAAIPSCSAAVAKKRKPSSMRACASKSFRV
jgi:hypothetical protein